ncbi:MAG: hypothetical protein B6D44_00380 [Ignavibacteriales bacterium UTCHB2]|nr:MAG: hypothetical protein B6D44_00380 [Ignavibacteriales bacterium UTCHB2]
MKKGVYRIAIKILVVITILTMINSYLYDKPNHYTLLLCLTYIFIISFVIYYLFKSKYYVSMVGLGYPVLVLLFSLGPWLFEIDSWILNNNRYTLPYLHDGSIVNVLLIGCLTLSLPITFIAGNKSKFEQAPVPTIINHSVHKLHAPGIKKAMTLVAISWLIMLYIYYTFIWYLPHLSAVHSSGILITLSAFIHVLNSFLFVWAIEKSYRLGSSKKTLIVYSLLMSILAISFGFRGAVVLMLISVFYFFSVKSEIKISFTRFAFISAIALFIFPFFGVVRFEIYNTSFLNIFLFYIQQSVMEGNISNFLYDMFPLVGQNLAHASAFVALYDQGQSSTLTPYLASILNFFPRPISELLGLPVNIYSTSAWYLSNYMVQSGGSYLFTEAYWLAGNVSLILFNIFYGIVFIVIDKNILMRAKQNKFLAHYITASLLMANSFGYGFSSFIRALYLIIFVELYFYFKRKPI